MPFTRGFRPNELRRHFFVSSLAYEALADTFVGGPLGADVAECTRPRGDLVRYNQVTQEFGVLSLDGVIKTFLILTATPVRNRVRFCDNCSRVA